MNDPIKIFANRLAAAGVDPDAGRIERPEFVPPGNWLRVQYLARAIVLQHLPERQRRLVELVFAAECGEAITDAVHDEGAIRPARYDPNE